MTSATAYQSGAVQTTVDLDPVIGVAGTVMDNAEGNRIVTKINDTSNTIPFGSYVKFVAGGKADVPGSSGDVTAVDGGILLVDKSKPTGVGCEPGDVMNVLIEGAAWIAAETAVTEETIPYIRYTAGSGGTAGTVPGGWAGASDASKNVQPTAGGLRFITAVAAAGIVGVRINFPQL